MPALGSRRRISQANACWKSASEWNSGQLNAKALITSATFNMSTCPDIREQLQVLHHQNVIYAVAACALLRLLQLVGGRFYDLSQRVMSISSSGLKPNDTGAYG